MMNLEELSQIIVNSNPHVNKDSLNEDTSFKSLDIDSLGMMDILLSVEESTGITVDDETIPSIKSVKDLLNIIN